MQSEATSRCIAGLDRCCSQRQRLALLRLLSLLSCVWLLSHACQARADAGCAEPYVRWSSDLPLPWQRALLAACDDLVSTKGQADGALDASVNVRALQRGRELELVVIASAGRTTRRSVRNTDELLMTMQALVLLPPSQRARAPVVTQAQAQPANDTLPPSAATPVRSDSLRQAFAVEIGAAVFGRLGFQPNYISPAFWLSVGLHVRSFTLGIDVRWNPLQTLISQQHPPGLEIESLGAGFFALQRVIDSDWTGLDLGLHAFLSADTRAWEVDETATESTVVDGRLGVLARWGFGSRGARWTLMLDAELSPGRLRAHSEFPTFGFGVGGGGVWEVK